MELSESLEDYLITIYDLALEGTDVHSGRVAQRVGVSTASVTHAFRALRARGLIEYERYQAVRLTADGAQAARLVIARKKTLIRFFSEVLGLDQEEAEHNAHRMEHVITPNAIERLGELMSRYDAGESVSRERPGPTDQ